MHAESWKNGTDLADFTTQILESADHPDDTCVLRRAEKYIKQKDQAFLLAEASKYQLIHKITMEIGWKKLWDQAMDHGMAYPLSRA